MIDGIQLQSKAGSGPVRALQLAIVLLGLLSGGAARGQGSLPASRLQPDGCASPLATLVPGCQTAAGPAFPIQKASSASEIFSFNNAGREQDKPQPATPPEPRPKFAPEAPGEFQHFAADSVGRVLPIFGANLFNDAPTTFAPVERAPVTADYVIGPGDEIRLRVWGQVNVNTDLTVDRAGAIYIPQAGSVVVAGLQFSQLTGFLRTHLEQVFRNFELNVTMGQLRSIQVFVVGQARRPGSYTVSSLSTLINTLFASGGPAVEGSLRNIQVKREDKTITEFDIYDLLLKGDKSKDVRLLPGDVIYIPPSGSQVAVSGSVKNQAIFELKGERTAADLVQMAGGLTQVADVRRAVLERIGTGGNRRTLDLSLDKAGLATPIENGDLLQILPIPPRFGNAVTLRGNVADPGRFPWRTGMRLRDIIPDRESLVTRAYWRKQNLLGFMPLASAQSEPIALQQEKDTPPKPITTKIEREAAPINWTYAVVERRDPRDLSTKLLPFNPGKLVLDSDDRENLELSPGDIVTFFSQVDIRVPQAQQSVFVRLEGEIGSAGIYTVKPGETLAQLIQRAGGFTPQAYVYGAEFTRESTRREQQARLDQFIRDWDREVEQQSFRQAGRTAVEEDVTRLKAEQDNARRLIEAMRSVKATGRIVLGLDRAQADVMKQLELPMEDGDVFLVPARPATVNVLGAVYNQNAFLYSDHLRVEDYLREAGGGTRSSDKKKMFVIRADGSVMPRQGRSPFGDGFEATRLNPGDSVVVPESFPKTPFLRNLRDWTQVLSQLALGAAVINVLK